VEVEFAGALKAVVFIVSVLGYSAWPKVGGGPKFRYHLEVVYIYFPVSTEYFVWIENI